MIGLAYSYLRFSTPEQAMGDSRRRQLMLAENYARQHGLILDKGLNFRDLGMSAFRGKNAKEGGLRSFLDAVEHSLVPANSYLLVESLDRLSRDRILEAQSLFLQIVSSGVTLVTLLDQRTYSKESLNANPTDLIISLVYMMRANEESATKSSRIKAARAALRDNPDIRFHGGQCPGWIRPNSNKNGYEVIPEKVAVIQRIFREAVEGRSLQLIARNLNREGVPLFGRGNQRGKLWQRALIRHLLYTPLVIGDYTPHSGELVNGKLRFMPTATKKGYYPSVVNMQDWEYLAARRKAWCEHYKCLTWDRTLVANVLSRLSRCPRCDRPMVIVRDENPNHRYLLCIAWREARQCSNEYVRYFGVEAIFVRDIERFIENCPQPQLHPEARRAMLRKIKGQLAKLRARHAREQEAHASFTTSGRVGRTWGAETLAEMEALRAERYRLRLDRSYWQDATVALKLEALRMAVLAIPRDIARINEKLRLLLLKVVVDWENNRLVMYWRHGGQSDTPFYRQRLKGTVRNKTPDLDDNAFRLRRSGSWPFQRGACAENIEQDILGTDGCPTTLVRLTGKLGNGHTMMLDPEDWIRVKREFGTEWSLKESTSCIGYVVSRRYGRATTTTPARQWIVVLARWLTNAEPEAVVTYRDGNPLNLIRSNLEVVERGKFSTPHLPSANKRGPQRTPKLMQLAPERHNELT